MKLQPNSWTCGPTALHNALCTLTTRPPSVARITRLSCANARIGCPPNRMKKAARALGYELREETRAGWYAARACIEMAHALGFPVIVVLDWSKEGPWAHWVCAYKSTKHYVWVADSQNPPPVATRMRWDTFLSRACTVTGPGESLFGLYVLWPGGIK